MSDATERLIATPSQTVGPFFAFGLTTNHDLGIVARPEAPGDHIRFRVRVIDGQGAAVPDAVVEIWQADAAGKYPPDSPDCRGFGRLGTDAEGLCTFDTIRPGSIVDAQGNRDAPHINVCLFMRGLLRHIYTRAYFADDPALSRDPVLAMLSDDGRESLIARPLGHDAAEWTFEIRLQGEDATVFFDL